MSLNPTFHQVLKMLQFHEFLAVFNVDTLEPAFVASESPAMIATSATKAKVALCRFWAAAVASFMLKPIGGTNCGITVTRLSSENSPLLFLITLIALAKLLAASNHLVVFIGWLVAGVNELDNLSLTRDSSRSRPSTIVFTFPRDLVKGAPGWHCRRILYISQWRGAVLRLLQQLC